MTHVACRIFEEHVFHGKAFTIREAAISDTETIFELFNLIYQGKYPLEFGNDPEILKAEIADHGHYLWLVTIDVEAKTIVGAMMFEIDEKNRMGKAGGGVVLSDYRHYGIASTMLKRGVHYVTQDARYVDVLYGTTRTVSEGPSRMIADAGFVKMGFFPNAVQIDGMEHLNLDLFITPEALTARRRKPYLFAPFYEVYRIAQKQLKLERAYLVTEREPLKLSGKKIQFELISDEREVIDKFRTYSAQNRISNSFFPFHMPNRLFSASSVGSDVFVWYGGVGKQASILGIRTDQVHIHDLLDSGAIALQKTGAAYVELLVDAYDYISQQEAYTAKYIPSAYFPAMRLAEDGLRDDYFVVNRTFQILDFTSSHVMTENFPYFELYMKFYNQLYINPVIKSDLSSRKKKT